MGAGIMGEVERVAVLRANALGDGVLALPAMEMIKQAYPGCRLTLLGLRWHADFWAGRPGPVDDVVVLPPIAGITAPRDPDDSSQTRDFYRAMRERRFDIALQMHGGGRQSNPLINAFDAGVTVGARTPDAESLDRWVPYDSRQHETLRLMEIAALIGGRPGSLEPHVAVTPADRAEVTALGELPPGLVAVHPGASDPRRRWPPERFAYVATRLGRPLVVTGTDAERPLVEQVTELSGARPLIDALSIGGLAALYERCDLVLSNDTGPRHLAAAVGTPTVSIYWYGNLISAGPLTRAIHRPLVSWTQCCPICGTTGDAAVRCPHDVPWVTDVPALTVLAEAQALLHGPRR
jgi:ADP-heptose:LPS heptosyltransferase